jgi:hypothetical protein
MTTYTFQSLFDFTRTTSGTFVGSNGLIQTTPASVNLLTYTQEFDNAAWTKANMTVTANSTVAPDGTSTADTITSSAAAGYVYPISSIFAAAGGATYTLTIYAKAGTVSTFQLLIAATATYTGNFNLSTGVATTATPNTTVSMVDAGNGWYRCVITAASVANTAYTEIQIGRIASGLTLNIWGAQLQTGSTATDYTRNNGGVYPARFDYDPATLAPKGILIEEQRVNLALYSQQFDNAAWVPSNITVTANAATSPDGTTNAELLTPSSTSALIYQSIVLTAASYTYSVWLRSGTGSNVSLNISANGSGVTPNPTSTAITVTPQWQRFTLQLSGLAAAANIIIGSTTAGTWPSGATIYAWGAQLEAGAFATSYIPTVASQVTRAADQCSIVAPLFAPWYNQTQGTIVSTFSSFATGSSSRIVAELNDGTSNNRYTQVHNPAGSDRFLTFSGGSAVVTTLDYSAVGVNVISKWAGAYAAGNYGASLNGAAALSATYGSVLAGVNLLAIGGSAGGVPLNGHIRSIQYYPVRLADFQLQALTA